MVSIAYMCESCHGADQPAYRLWADCTERYPTLMRHLILYRGVVSRNKVGAGAQEARPKPTGVVTNKGVGYGMV